MSESDVKDPPDAAPPASGEGEEPPPARDVQIALTYQPDEDRVMMRCRIKDQDVRAWLTRRLVMQWLGASGKIFDHIGGPTAMPQEQRRAIADFQRDAVAQETDFTKPYTGEELVPYPPSGPLLVTKLNFTMTADKRCVITFTGTIKEAVRLSLSERELHAVLHMLCLTVEKAQWNQRIDTGSAGHGAVPKTVN